MHLRALGRDPVFAVLLGDSKRYVEWAAEIAAGNWLGWGAFYQAPLYPYVLAALFSVFGQSVEIVRVVQAVAGAAACVCLAIAARSWFDWRAGVVAGLALAMYPAAIFFDGHVQKASLDLLLMTLMVMAIARYQSSSRGVWLAMLGVSLGCFTLTRENARLLYPVLAVWLLWWARDAPLKDRLQKMALLTAAVLIPIVPVALRNYAVAGELLVSTSQLGSNLYIGNHRGASGVYEPLVPDRGSALYEQEDAVRLASTAAGRALSPSEVSRFWIDRTLDDIRHDPAGWTRLMFRKLLLSLNTVEAMDTESIEFHAARSAILATLMPWTFGMLLPLAVGGIILSAAEFRRLAALYGVAAVFMGSTVLFFVLARYRHAVVPVLMVFAGAGLVTAASAWRQQPRRLAVAAACAFAVAIVVNRPMRATSDETAANFGTELLRLERPREAIPLLAEAVALLPSEPGAHRDLGLALLKSGDSASAAREYAIVARLEPGSAANHRELAVAAEAAGDSATALDSLREAARLEPDRASTQTKLGDLLVRRGQSSEARRVYERAVAIGGASPEDVVALEVRIASLDVAQGRIGDALARLEGAAARARASGQTTVVRDLEATIGALRSRR